MSLPTFKKTYLFEKFELLFPQSIIEEFLHNLDYAIDIDYLGWVGEKAFGIQIKPVTAKANFGNYSLPERIKNSFADFEAEFGGKVFIVYSLDGEIANTNVVEEIKTEIARLLTSA